MTTTANELVGSITKLTSFPDVAIRINDMLSDENSGATEIGALIETDPALSAAMLRISNSPLYNVGGSVDSIDRAVTIVGTREVRDLAFGICASETFKGIPNDLITVEDFWRHCIFCASAAQCLGKKASVSKGESYFCAGLLHDIGHLVMFNQEPELSTKALQHSLDNNDGLSPYLSEREIFGFDHMDVGGELARQWRLPDTLRHAIQYHHEPFSAEEVTDAALVIHVANSIAVLAELGSLNLDDAPPIDERVLSELGIDSSIVPDVIEKTQESVDELLRIFVN